MDIKQIRAKKSLKLITLLLTAFMIAGVSAATYYSMTISGTITIKTADVIWVTGTNANTTITISGSTATVGLNVVNGTAQNFTSCLYLKNLGAHAYSVNFTTTSALPSASFSTAKVLVYTNTTGASVTSLDLTTAGATSTLNSLPSGATGVWTLVFDIVHTAGATTSFTFAVKVTYQ